jgi:hypothetical protein
MDENLPNSSPEKGPEHKDDEGGNNSQVDYSNKLNPIISPIAAAFIGLLGGFFLYQIVGGLLTLAIFGLDLEKAPINGFRLITMGGQILFILLPALVFSKWFYEDVTAVIRFRPARWKEIGLFVIGIIILTPLLQNFVVIQNYFFDKLASSSASVHSVKSVFDSLNDKVETTYSNLLTAHSVPEGLFVILIVAVVPALCEEVMFRGFIQKSFELKLKPYWAILITSVFFGLYHFNPYGLIPLIALGFYFGFAVYISDSIFTSMSLHFTNNFIAVIMFFIAGNQDITSPSSGNAVDLKSSVTVFVSLLVIFIGVIYMIVKYYKNKKSYA